MTSCNTPHLRNYPTKRDELFLLVPFSVVAILHSVADQHLPKQLPMHRQTLWQLNYLGPNTFNTQTSTSNLYERASRAGRR